MKQYLAASRMAQRLFAAKRRRRQQLARLSFREKIAIVVRMQEIENGIRQARHRPLRPAWIA